MVALTALHLQILMALLWQVLMFEYHAHHQHQNQPSHCSPPFIPL